MCVYAQSDCVETVCELPLLANNNASEIFLHKSGAMRSVDWMFIIAGLAMPGRIRDTGQNVSVFFSDRK
jgi:hypothetical protein